MRNMCKIACVTCAQQLMVGVIATCVHQLSLLLYTCMHVSAPQLHRRAEQAAGPALK